VADPNGRDVSEHSRVFGQRRAQRAAGYLDHLRLSRRANSLFQDEVLVESGRPLLANRKGAPSTIETKLDFRPDCEGERGMTLGR
jgi:hypothetical protein